MRPATCTRCTACPKTSAPHAEAEDFLDRLQAWQVELRVVLDAGDAERILSFLVYTSRVHCHAHPRTVRKRIAAVVGPEQENAMQSFYEMAVQDAFDEGFDKGREDGLEKGIETGLEKGQRAMLLRLLGRRFGAVPEPIAARVATATPPELERWSDRVLDASSLDDVFRGA